MAGEVGQGKSCGEGVWSGVLEQSKLRPSRTRVHWSPAQAPCADRAGNTCSGRWRNLSWQPAYDDLVPERSGSADRAQSDEGVSPDPDAGGAFRGPHGWLNWLAQRSGDPARTDSHTDGALLIPLWQEYALYSDADFRDELDLGPASVRHAFPADEQRLGHAQLQLVLRVHTHLADPDYDPEAWRTEDVSVYHGGDLDDEFAALLSLALGRRLRSGGSIRLYISGDDPAGRPFMGWHQQPQLAAPAGGRSVLPGVAATGDLGDARELMETYSRASGPEAAAVVRAATQYADALWWADLDPRISWIKLVGALEISANRWSASQGLSPLERFKRYLGPLYGRMKKHGQEVVQVVAEHLGEHAGAQQRFVEFTVVHGDIPPEIRPEVGVVDWARLRDPLKVIYDWRSRDLHAGVPFPGPMCEPPRSDAEGVLFECFPALGAEQAGGRWPAERLPMYLHTFAFLVRQALTRWWASLPDAGLVSAARRRRADTLDP